MAAPRHQRTEVRNESMCVCVSCVNMCIYKYERVPSKFMGLCAQKHGHGSMQDSQMCMCVLVCHCNSVNAK